MQHELENMDTIDAVLSQYFSHDLVLLPFLFDTTNSEEKDNHEHVYHTNPETQESEAICGCAEEKRAILVSVKVLDN